MAQVMQWPPAIRNYMRKVRSKYQHVPPLFISCIPFALTGFYIHVISAAEWSLYWELKRKKSRSVKVVAVFIG